MELTRSLLVCFYHICSISTIFLFLDLSYQIPTPTLLYDIWYHIFAHCFHKLGQFPFSISCHLTSLSFCKTLFVKPELISPWLGAKFMSKTSHHIIFLLIFVRDFVFGIVSKCQKCSISYQYFLQVVAMNFLQIVEQEIYFANRWYRSQVLRIVTKDQLFLDGFGNS